MDWNPEIIRSRQNKTVVEVGKLTDRKEREARQLFRFDGIKLLLEALASNLEITLILLKESGAEFILSRARKRFGKNCLAGVERVLTLSDEVFDKISEEKSPEGVICVAKYIDKSEKNATIYNDVLFSSGSEEQFVLLESVRDPSNIGAIIRSASAMGVDRLILSRDCADIYHPKAVRASMGTLFRQKILRVDCLPDAVEKLRACGRTVYAAALDENACRLGSFPIQKGDCVVIGNEGHGLSDEVLKACDKKVFIPMQNNVESLNAGVAASVLMWEFSRFRRG